MCGPKKYVCKDCKKSFLFITRDHVRALQHVETLKIERVCRNCHDLREFWRGRIEIKEERMHKRFCLKECRSCKYVGLGVAFTHKDICSNCDTYQNITRQKIKERHNKIRNLEDF